MITASFLLLFESVHLVLFDHFFHEPNVLVLSLLVHVPQVFVESEHFYRNLRARVLIEGTTLKHLAHFTPLNDFAQVSWL